MFDLICLVGAGETTSFIQGSLAWDHGRLNRAGIPQVTQKKGWESRSAEVFSALNRRLQPVRFRLPW